MNLLFRCLALLSSLFLLVALAPPARARDQALRPAREELTKTFASEAPQGGAAAVVSRYEQLRKTPRAYDFSVSQLNGLGYVLKRRGDVAGALRIFQLNAATFPDDWNVHDSLGEAQLESGDKAGAIASYKRSLELNSGNDNARQVLQKLGAS
jgi:tetratricopeptide (TPR) repeat protein